MSMIVVATALVTTLVASSFPAVAQPTSEHCGTAEELQLIGSELFVCDSGGGMFFCPEGFVEVDNPVDPPVDPEGPTIASEGPTFLCAPAPSDSGNGGDDGGGSGGGGNGGGSDGGGSGGGGSGSGSGGGATPITQEGDQQSEAGQVDQSFEVS